MPENLPASPFLRKAKKSRRNDLVYVYLIIVHDTDCKLLLYMKYYMKYYISSSCHRISVLDIFKKT
jgi:hypothetical protein